MNNFEIIKELYAEKNYTHLEEHFSASNDCRDREVLAKIFFLRGELKKASKLYKELDLPYHQGYCELLSGNIEFTKKLWDSMEDSSAIAAWGNALLGVLLNDVKNSPTFFQVRNFLEVDLENFLKYECHEYVNAIVNHLWLFEQINPECNKYVARVFFNHDRINEAIKLLKRHNDFYFKDPEAHVMLARCYLSKGDTQKAIKSLENCLACAPSYYPALMLLEQLK